MFYSYFLNILFIYLPLGSCHCTGDVDELNAHLGVCREHCEQASNDLERKLEEIQSRLIDIGTAIATWVSLNKYNNNNNNWIWGGGSSPPSASENKLKRAQFSEEHVSQLENWIDELDGQLVPLRNFILPVSYKNKNKKNTKICGEKKIIKKKWMKH